LRQHYKEYLQNLELIRECELGMDELLSDHLSTNEIDPSQASAERHVPKGMSIYREIRVSDPSNG
jgi:hypothetical protein